MELIFRLLIGLICVISITILILVTLWIFKIPVPLFKPMPLSNDNIFSLLGVFIMVLAILITISYSNQQIREGKESTRQQLDKMDEEISLVKGQIEKGNEQIVLLHNQALVSNALSLFELGNRCMWNTPHGGDYDSYLFLKSMSNDPVNKEIEAAIDHQISRVEKKYRATDMMIVYAAALKSIWRDDVKDPEKEDVWAKIDTVTVNNIFCHMKERNLESENIKAAYFMTGITDERLRASGKTWEDAFEMLIWAMNNDAWCLYGRKMALIAYCQLAEKNFPGVFDFEAASKDWGRNKQEILKKKNSHQN